MMNYRLPLVFNVHLPFQPGRFQNGVADDSVFIAIQEIRAVWGNAFVIDDGVKQVVNFMNKSVFPADDVPVRPPVRPEGVVAFADQYAMEALRFFWLLTYPEHFHLIHAFQVKADTAFFAVDFKTVGVFVTACKACGFDRSDGAVFKLDGGYK